MILTFGKSNKRLPGVQQVVKMLPSVPNARCGTQLAGNCWNPVADVVSRFLQSARIRITHCLSEC